MSETTIGSNIRHRTGCLVCGKQLRYFEQSKKLECALCGESFEGNCACEAGHYVCDKCHAASSYEIIKLDAIKSDSKNPIALATIMMEGEHVNMHGPEHHFLVVAALLAAYKNAGGDIDLPSCLEKALKRAKNVPGGICGMWGSCGAAIATGIFVSVILGATSLSVEEWSRANEMTSRSLLEISKNGGPRCCKRNTYLAIDTAIDFASENFSIFMEKESPKCKFFHLNKQCKKSNCIYFKS